jgi:site-specific recombinase XerD
LISTVKRPVIHKQSEHGQMYDTGVRLSLSQVNKIFKSFMPGASDLADIATLRGKRDYLMLYILFTTGLRRRELTRVTLNSIEEVKNTRVIRVRGKRNKQIYVPIDDDAYASIMNFVALWNSVLDDNDPRRIHGDMPIFQPLHARSDHAMLIPGVRCGRGSWRYDPSRPLDPRTIGEIVKSRSQSALGFSIQAHDCRRTLAKMMQDEGYSLKDIQLILNHTSPATTEKYIGSGQINVLYRSRVTNKVRFFHPEAQS